MIRTLKKNTKELLDRVVIPFCEYVALRIPVTTVLRELENRTTQDCADYVQTNMPRALQFQSRKDLWDHALSKRPPEGLIAEFGVWKGRSINHFARRARPNRVFGFDSFDGLREDWAGWTETKGKFSLKGRLPRVESNVTLVRGWFEETLPGFLAVNPSSFSLVHLDSDTYESTQTVLEHINARIVAGTVIVFDEYLGYRGWRIGEYKAWQEFVAQNGIEYEYLAFSTQPVSLRILRRPCPPPQI